MTRSSRPTSTPRNRPAAGGAACTTWLIWATLQTARETNRLHRTVAPWSERCLAVTGTGPVEKPVVDEQLRAGQWIVWDLADANEPTAERLTDWAASLTSEIGGSLHQMTPRLLLLSPVIPKTSPTCAASSWHHSGFEGNPSGSGDDGEAAAGAAATERKRRSREILSDAELRVRHHARPAVADLVIDVRRYILELASTGPFAVFARRARAELPDRYSKRSSRKIASTVSGQCTDPAGFSVETVESVLIMLVPEQEREAKAREWADLFVRDGRPRPCFRLPVQERASEAVGREQADADVRDQLIAIDLFNTSKRPPTEPGVDVVGAVLGRREAASR